MIVLRGPRLQAICPKCGCSWNEAAPELEPPIKPPQELIKQFKAWRFGQARNEGCQLWKVFTNADLEKIAHVRPATTDELAQIKGVGPRRKEKYAADILRIILDFAKKGVFAFFAILLLCSAGIRAEYLLVSSMTAPWGGSRFDSDGYQYIYGVVDNPWPQSDYVGKFDTNLNQLFVLANGAFTFAQDVAVDNYGNRLYMIDRTLNPTSGYDYQIRAFSLANGSQLDHWLAFNGPLAANPRIVVSYSGSVYFVTRKDTGLSLKIYSSAGSLIKEVFISDLWWCGAIKVGGNGFLYLLAGGSSSSVYKYDLVGNRISSFPVQGTDGLMVDSQGFFYVKDTDGNIFKYSSGGNLILTIVKPAWATNYSPTGLTGFDGNRLFVLLSGGSTRLGQWRWNTPPSNPTLISPNGSVHSHVNGINLTWNSSVDAEGDPVAYEVLMGSAPAALVKIGETDYSSFEAAGLSFGQTYYWKVRAKDAYSSSESQIAQFSFILDNTAPSAPAYSNLNLTTRDTREYLDWDYSTDP
ncbi:MAG: HRDC domain-containing protein, partial [Elusimicrobiota bacterium]